MSGILLAVWLGASLAAPTVRARAESANPLQIEVEVVGLVAAPESEVRAVLLDLEGFGRWFPATAEWRVLGRSADGVVRVYGRQALPWPVSDRDYVVEYRAGEADGGFTLVAVALDTDEPPAPRGVVRVARMRTEWRIRPGSGGTEVSYRYEGDVGGRIPDWAARAGWRSRTPIVIDRLREELSRRRGADESVDPRAVHGE